MKRRCIIEDAVGETRAAVYEGKQLVEAYVRRWTEADKPRAGDVFAGRITEIDKSMGAAFVDVGLEPHGFLKFSNAPGAPRFANGMIISVEVTREAEPGKGPILKYQGETGVDKPAKISGDNLMAYIAKRYPNIKFDSAAVSVIEDATEREIAVPGGGDIAIDFTRALVAIDVDKGPAASGFAVGQAVCPIIAQQLRLRSIGGLILVDLPNLRQPNQRAKLFKAMEAAFADDPNTVKIAPMSRFGTVEMTRMKTGPSLDEVLNDRYGRPTLETRALRALRALEREGRASGGAKLELTVPQDVMDWLEAGHIDWRVAMTERLGARFSVSAGEDMSVKADR